MKISVIVTVIVPVYNSEKYLRKCISSVIHQTYSDWELILVDDGSTDSSLEIVDRVVQNDKRIRAIHQENTGPGIARNTGIEKLLVTMQFSSTLMTS